MGPWFLMGDFNNVMSVQDKIGGNPMQEMEYRDLREMMILWAFLRKIDVEIISHGRTIISMFLFTQELTEL